VESDDYTGSFGLQWTLHKKTQLDSHTGLSISRERLFRTTGWPERMDGQVILEAGSGAGRFTEILLETGAEIFSFDYSLAVEANWSNNGHNANLNLFQGDIYNIPLKMGIFDKVLCLGVLQHTPDPEKAFRNLCRYLRPGGEIAVDCYPKRLSSMLHWKYVLRPLTKHMKKETLYSIIKSTVPRLLLVTGFIRNTLGKTGLRILPIADYSHLNLASDLRVEWSILDTFDMYSPQFDHPQSFHALQSWTRESNLTDIRIEQGFNGWIVRGKRLS
jgi:SAM-dependent methyltransferase